MRHFSVKAAPVGVYRYRCIRRLIQGKMPNLSKCKEIADHLAGDGFQSDATSDSEPEDDPNLVLQFPDKYVGKGNHKSQKSTLKLFEIGPRCLSN
jgi:ribosome biogenesis protein SSF1/2